MIQSNNQQHYTAWTDGSCDNRNPMRPGGSAYIILNEGGSEYKRASKGFINTTNNRMELLAIISVVNSLPHNSFVTINTDSQYCITALKSKQPKKNLDQVDLYHRLVNNKNIHVVFKWIRGHGSYQYNELCDQMARGEYAKIAFKTRKKSTSRKKVTNKPIKKAVPNRIEEAYYSQITTKGRRKSPKKK